MQLEKVCKYTIRIILIFLLISLTALGIVYALMQNNPKELADHYLTEVARKTGLDISFKSVHVTLLPLPAIGIGDLNIKGEDYELNIAWLGMRPNLKNLLQGDFLPGKISIVRPKFYLKTELPLENPDNLIKESSKLFPQNNKSSDGLGKLFQHFYCDIDLIQGYAQIDGINGQKAFLSSLDADLEISESGILTGKADFGHFRAVTEGKLLYALEAFNVKGELDIDNFLEEPAYANITGRIKIANILKKADISINLENSSAAWAANIDIQADLEMNNYAVPGSFKGRIFGLADSNEILCRRADFVLDADSGNMELRFRLPSQELPWQLAGKLYVHRASLTQWLGFARGLPPGLQIALDNILDAKLEFVLDNHSLDVKNISAVSTGARFNGSGGVPDFAKPVVMLDLKSEQANLGLAVPESLFKSVEPVNFPYEPFTPRSGIPLAEGEQGIGYDIKLAAKTLIYGPLVIKNATLRIYPGRMDTIRLEDVLMDATGDFYGGNLQGHCILGADPSLPVYIAYTAKNIDMALLSKALPVAPIKKGLVQSEAKVFSKGKKLKDFLNNLDGPVKISGTKIYVSALENFPVSKLLISNDLKGAQLIKNGINFGGKWLLEAVVKEFSGSINLDGKLSFNNTGLILNSVPAKLKINLTEKFGPLPEKSSYSLQGQLSGQTANNQFSLAKLNMELPGAKLNGNVNLNIKSANCQGEVKAQISDTQKLFQYFGLGNFQMPKLLKSVGVNSTFSANKDAVHLQNLILKAGDLESTGNLNVSLQQSPALSFDLSLNRIDWEKDFPNTSAKRKSKLDFTWIRDYQCKGNLKIASFSGWGFNITGINIPMELKEGKLKIDSLKGRFCGAPLQAQIEATLEKGVRFKTILAANEFKLEDVARARKLESVLLGNVSIDGVFSATINETDQILSRLDGIWNIKISSASFQSRDKKGDLKGTPTKIDFARASGKMNQGRMESKDILLKNSDMQISGEGWLNLVSQKVDCKLNVNMKNLPDFPLYVYGPLDNPKTSIGAGKLVLNAIGGIGTGIGNMFGSLFKGIVNVFR